MMLGLQRYQMRSDGRSLYRSTEAQVVELFEPHYCDLVLTLGTLYAHGSCLPDPHVLTSRAAVYYSAYAGTQLVHSWTKALEGSNADSENED
eukprot:scaffold1400_cov137-Cylindrotheca_fusiformis.AAC.14